MSVSACNNVNMFDHLQVSESVSVAVVSCKTVSATAAAKVITQSISEWATAANDRAAKWCDVTIHFTACHYIICIHALSCIVFPYDVTPICHL